MNREIVEKGIKRAATVPDRIVAFNEAGLRLSDIASAVDVTPSSVKNWIDGMSPRREAFGRLDALRGVLGRLMARGLEPEAATAWLTSVDFDAQPPLSPLERIKDQPEVVFEMIDEEFPTQT